MSDGIGVEERAAAVPAVAWVADEEAPVPAAPLPLLNPGNADDAPVPEAAGAAEPAPEVRESGASGAFDADSSPGVPLPAAAAAVDVPALAAVGAALNEKDAGWVAAPVAEFAAPASALGCTPNALLVAAP